VILTLRIRWLLRCFYRHCHHHIHSSTFPLGSVFFILHCPSIGPSECVRCFLLLICMPSFTWPLFQIVLSGGYSFNTFI
jgi:hypothetical protein